VARVTTALLLSGGMDSVAIAYWCRPEFAITIDYGQRSAKGEIRASQTAAEILSIPLFVVRANLSELGSGDMAGMPAVKIAPASEWWPFRNQMLVTLAAMKGVTIGVQRLLIGAIKTDQFHADGRPEFIKGLNALLAVQEGEITLEAPAIELTASDLIRQSGVPLELLSCAHSCHISDYACGLCRGCRKHYETLRDLGESPY
jgi:7-cyano-7-deazaguanine synthase